MPKQRVGSPSGAYAPVQAPAQVVIREAPGTDVTAEIQAAINAANTANQDVVIVLIPTAPGALLVSGAQQTGIVTSTSAGTSYTYSGQIVFPAREFTAGRISVKICGITPPAGLGLWNVVPNEPASVGGPVLLSNATSGNVFDAIPSANATETAPFVCTNIFVEFANLTIRTPNNPAAGGIRAVALVCLSTDKVVVGVNAAGAAITMPQTNTAIGIETPAKANGNHVHLKDTQVAGYSTGIKHYEHTHLDYCTIQSCSTAVAIAGAGGHEMHYTRLLVQSCQTVLDNQLTVSFGAVVTGNIDVEGGNVTSMINDPNDLLFGDLRIYFATFAAGSWGWPVTGAHNVRLTVLRNNTGTNNGVVDTHTALPWDTFGRSLDVAGSMGTCDRSAHPWQASRGSFTTSAGKAKVSAGDGNNNAQHLVPYYLRTGGGSRLITATLTTATTGYDIGVAINATSTGHSLVVRLVGGLVQIVSFNGTSTTTLASSAAATVTGNSTYTLSVVFSAPLTPGATWTCTAYIGTTQVVTYTLLTADVTFITDATPSRLRRDGLFAFNDLVSTCSLFRVDALGEAA